MVPGIEFWSGSDREGKQTQENLQRPCVFLRLVHTIHFSPLVYLLVGLAKRAHYDFAACILVPGLSRGY